MGASGLQPDLVSGRLRGTGKPDWRSDSSRPLDGLIHPPPKKFPIFPGPDVAIGPSGHGDDQSRRATGIDPGAAVHLRAGLAAPSYALRPWRSRSNLWRGPVAHDPGRPFAGANGRRHARTCEGLEPTRTGLAAASQPPVNASMTMPPSHMRLGAFTQLRSACPGSGHRQEHRRNMKTQYRMIFTTK